VDHSRRIPLIANGTVDLECGSTTNNIEREKQVSFTITHFVTANRFVSKKANNLKTVDDLKGKTIVSTSGTTNIKHAGTKALASVSPSARTICHAFLLRRKSSHIRPGFDFASVMDFIGTQ
jgi:ABC-type amino acid transport substrate-binding protein